MASANKCVFIGNLTKDVDLRYTANGTAVCNFSIACNERFKDRDGNVQEKTEYVNIVCWKGLAENCGKFLTKGRSVYVDGKLQTRKYETKDGETRYITEIVAQDVQFLGGKDSPTPQQERPAQSQPQRTTGGEDNNQFSPDDDRIPF